MSSDGETKAILTELLPNKQYFLRVALFVKESGEEITSRSDILSVTTLSPVPPGPPGVELRPIDVKLEVDNVKPDSAHISWRYFSFDEKQYIDGVQIRYTSLLDGSGVPGTSPFIHRDTNFFDLKGKLVISQVGRLDDATAGQLFYLCHHAGDTLQQNYIFFF